VENLPEGHGEAGGNIDVQSQGPGVGAGEVRPLARQVNFVRDFRKDCLAVMEAVERGRKFAFARFGTGECAILKGKPVHARGSHWHGDPERNATYYAALQTAWKCERPEWYVGAGCPCCNPAEHHWYKKNLHIPREGVTFATLFMGSNWKLFHDWLMARRSSYVLVAPHHGDFECPANTFEPNWDWTQLRENLLQTLNGTPVMLACGPLGKILCHELLDAATGPLIDIGSALDLELWGKPTRLYLKKPKRKKHFRQAKAKAANDRIKRLRNRTCVWKLSKKAVHKS